MTELMVTRPPEIKPVHILAGLGKAERDLLATCLALLDDSTLTARLAHLYENAKDKGWSLTQTELKETEQAVRSALGQWKTSPWSDDDLRIILWIRLREAMGLGPALSATIRGCSQLADDLSAHMIHVLDPPSIQKLGKSWLGRTGWLEENEQAITLGDIVLPVLDEILEKSPNADQFPADPAARRQALSDAVGVMARSTEEEQAQLVQDLGADKLNDSAIRKSLVLGGSLGAFGVAVGSSGFSAYILAAQASAFVPLVSGPGLVSLVSVLSNPVTILASIGGGAWWFAHSAGRKVRANVAARIIAMITIRGLLAGPGGLDGLRAAFAQLPRHKQYEGVADSQLQEYRREWERLQPIWKKQVSQPSTGVLSMMEKPVDVSKPGLAVAFAPDGGSTGNERANAAALATMTVGDVLYSAAAVDPTVIEAADFSRLADIDGRVPFAELAHGLLAGSDPVVQGGINQLKGYVAEKAVAAELAAAGHAVSFPDASNSPGWDIMVDGEPFQVKFHESLQGIQRHFERYDYPVLANTELQGSIPDELTDRVFFVDGISNEVVTHVTEQSLNAADGMTDAGSPFMVGLVSATRGLMAYRSGELTGRQTLEQILVDGTVRFGLFGAGGVAGTYTGLVLFGPAGAWVLGPGASILAQMQTPRATKVLQNLVKIREQREWEDAVHNGLDTLTEAISAALNAREKQFAEKLASVPRNEVGRYLTWRLSDDHCFASECLLRLEWLDRSECPDPARRASELFRLLAMSSIHPVVYQSELSAVNELLEARPDLSEILQREEVGHAWQASQETMKRGTDWAKNTIKGFNWPGSKRDHE